MKQILTSYRNDLHRLMSMPESWFRTDCKFHVGDHVYYVFNGDTIPARVVAVGKSRVKIHGNFLEGDRETWVSPNSLEAQQ